jgi:predicted transposase YbfD/YdcC
MSQPQTLPLLSSFSDLADPRVERTRHHKLLDIVGLTVCAVIAGADDWVHVEYFGKAKIDWLKTFLDLPNGIPSHDTIGRVFASLDSEKFAEGFSGWVAGFSGKLGLKHVAFDGKCLRRSGDSAKGKKAIHAVSAWACDARLTLGLTAVDEKSNEITAIPKLLEMLELEGALVTIDAMGCQKGIASSIREAGADYLLQVKGNQPRLQEDIATVFDTFVGSDMTTGCHDRHETTEKGHGREEERSVFVFTQVDEIRDKDLWADLKSLIVVWRGRKVGDKQSGELSYYISSKLTGAKEFAEATRGHWGIENGCHWVLDVAFREDLSRVREGNAATNFAIVRRMALAMLKNVKGAKNGVGGRRLNAAWDTTFLEKVLQVEPPSN